MRLSESQHQPPMAPQAVEAGQHGFACRQGVALDLHVQEELGDRADGGTPQEDEADLRGDVGPENELARRQRDAGPDDAGANDAPELAGRVGQVADDLPRQPRSVVEAGRGMRRRRAGHPS